MRLVGQGKLREAFDLLLEFQDACNDDRLLRSVMLTEEKSFLANYPRLTRIVQSEIRYLVAKSNLLNASNLLLEFMMSCNNDRVDEAIILVGSIRDFVREKETGTLDYQLAVLEKNKLSLRMLGMMKDYSNEGLKTILSV